MIIDKDTNFLYTLNKKNSTTNNITNGSGLLLGNELLPNTQLNAIKGYVEDDDIYNTNAFVYDINALNNTNKNAILKSTANNNFPNSFDTTVSLSSNNIIEGRTDELNNSFTDIQNDASIHQDIDNTNTNENILNYRINSNGAISSLSLSASLTSSIPSISSSISSITSFSSHQPSILSTSSTSVKSSIILSSSTPSTPSTSNSNTSSSSSHFSSFSPSNFTYINTNKYISNNRIEDTKSIISQISDTTILKPKIYSSHSFNILKKLGCTYML